MTDVAVPKPAAPAKHRRLTFEDRLRAIEDIALRPGTTLGPENCEKALLAEFGNDPLRTAAALLRPAIRIARGRAPSARQKAPSTHEVLAALAHLHRVTGAKAKTDGLGPLGKLAGAQADMVEIARRLASRRAPAALPELPAAGAVELVPNGVHTFEPAKS